uniref:Uncharacterized protein n=1 Tax=Branchiostoma floridae TaxID=7739 RepID=C3Y862_BRAFL|eukprot:XP_002607521.1 hypothetical protein BRAFLDRAFT_69952 [Branchiostoma floridae]
MKKKIDKKWKLHQNSATATKATTATPLLDKLPALKAETLAGKEPYVEEALAEYVGDKWFHWFFEDRCEMRVPVLSREKENNDVGGPDGAGYLLVPSTGGYEGHINKARCIMERKEYHCKKCRVHGVKVPRGKCPREKCGCDRGLQVVGFRCQHRRTLMEATSVKEREIFSQRNVSLYVGLQDDICLAAGIYYNSTVGSQHMSMSDMDMTQLFRKILLTFLKKEEQLKDNRSFRGLL